MAQKTATKQVLRYLLGICVPSPKQNAAKIRVNRLEFDSHLLMYFSKYDFIYALDPDKRCKTGDTVLIQNLPEKATRIITHKVVDVVYPLGDISDPITDKKIVVGKYRDEVDEDSEWYGKLSSKFKHEKAPPRGATRGVRDFTDKSITVRYHDDPNDSDPYKVNPS